MAKKAAAVQVVTHEQYTGMSSDELNQKYNLDGWPCTHEPPHGIALRSENKFVVTRHFPDERPIVVVTPVRLRS